MTNRFTLPVLVASAFHAGLLSLTWDSAPCFVAVEPPAEEFVFVVPKESPDDVEWVAQATPVRKGNSKAERPSADEFISKERAIFEMPAREPMPRAPVDVTRIEPDEWGDPMGAEELGGRVPVLSVGALDQAPRAKVRVAPVYPSEARAAEATGEVWVEFVVDEAGRVTRPRVMRSTDVRFEAATLRAVEKWRFEPGTKHGAPVRFRMAVPVVFSLDA